MVDKKQILDVLHYIKKECEKQGTNCDDCMFSVSDGLCSIQDPPQEWRLKENEEEKKWSPFKN